MAIRSIIKRWLLLVNFVIKRRNKNKSQRSEVTVGEFVGCKMFLIKLLKLKWNHVSLPTAWRVTKFKTFANFYISSSDVINVTKIWLWKILYVYFHYESFIHLSENIVIFNVSFYLNLIFSDFSAYLYFFPRYLTRKSTTWAFVWAYFRPNRTTPDFKPVFADKTRSQSVKRLRIS